jgi:hypothetical protein
MQQLIKYQMDINNSMFKTIALLSSLLILLISFNILHNFININTSFSQNIPKQKTTNIHSWISKKDNLNISIKLDPQTPIVDQNTKISFAIKKLSNSIPANFANLSVKVTMVNSDGEIFKFGKQNIIDNRFVINYKFPNNGIDRAIFQLYKNEKPFDIGSFDINVPVPPPPANPLTNLFKGL